ncbi:MAG: type II toxin-antitoxin system RelE/ParE family toxin [Gemmatimonadota bacterium]|nr:type II toxin-antitoxin system RelE/ParE family toxin [Gemmatimonadota bacterium]
MRIRFRLEAAEDVEGARAWYDEQQSGLGDAFVASLENVIDLVAEFPEAFPEIAAGHRRAHLHRFPYAVYYRLDSGVIDVLACLHSSRSPEVWRPRRPD